jgi:hypothetical protein
MQSNARTEDSKFIEVGGYHQCMISNESKEKLNAMYKNIKSLNKR